MKEMESAHKVELKYVISDKDQELKELTYGEDQESKGLKSAGE